MKSSTSRRFRDAFANLPEEVRTLARRSYKSFRQNPMHPGLQFKKVEGQANIYSIRAGHGYRALGQMEGDEIVWFWIGTHAEYNRLV